MAFVWQKSDTAGWPIFVVGNRTSSVPARGTRLGVCAAEMETAARRELVSRLWEAIIAGTSEKARILRIFRAAWLVSKQESWPTYSFWSKGDFRWPIFHALRRG
jgi:hypothetical protein